MGFGGFCLKQAVNFQVFKSGVRYFSPRHPGIITEPRGEGCVFGLGICWGLQSYPHTEPQEVAARMSRGKE